MEKRYYVGIGIALALVAGAVFLGLSARHWDSLENTARASKDADAFVRMTLEDCQKSPVRESKACHQQAARTLLDVFSLAQVLSIFDRHEAEPLFFDNCHEVAHFLGQEAYRRMRSVSQIFAQSSRACLGGAFHGAVEGYFMERAMLPGMVSDAVMGQEIANLCGEKKTYTRPQDFIECNHGMGHALMFLAEDDLLRALHLCDYLPNTEQRQLCFTGALMANFTGAQSKDHPAKYFRADDPLYPCPILSDEYQEMCYTYGVLSLHQEDYEKAVAICRLVPEHYQDACFKTYGRDRTMITSDAATITRQCSIIGSPIFERDCVNAAAFNLVIRFGMETVYAFNLCALQSGASAGGCYGELVRAAQRSTRDVAAMQAFCSRIPEAYRNGCGLDALQ
ncbi:MAG: hypothetical protein A2756_03470 [Candidatus Ryanbacteria bacterium RIFCSPHIGHO2_01_FULL_48_27]|uniref:Uncharacterized protein n=1 Tax=Candidatus Ryanbacteria bacterium RIFCSPHIGHO2_01_FULL_48_27 TaxID=1802115 RepID=A0A1G2G3T4_9BACT|nr:MAG: hypothetical protein A2756_03470 [Candidatus Ryanbacteria bacterium RIFCSPHIGHO2_01_FULL_48_27]